jgi:branched-chain amino acid transport system substrate-binding protein
MKGVRGMRSDHDAGDGVDEREVSCETRGKGVSRREFLRMAAIAGGAVGLAGGIGPILAACGESEATTTSGAPTTTTAPASATTTMTGTSSTVTSVAAETGRALKVGVVAPQTGGLAPFAASVNWAVDRLSNALKDGMLCGDGKWHKLDFVKKDTQSDPQRAAGVTGELIQQDKVDIVLSSGAPDTVNPSADICEAMACPSLSSASVWQAFYFDRKPPADGFKWTYATLLGSELTIACFVEMFDQIPNNRVVGMLFANDADAAGWMAENAAPAVFKAKGYTLVQPSWYTPGAEDFTQQIAAFKKGGCEIICGSNNPAEFTNFFKQCIQQGFKPKLVSSGKALLFPETLAAIGPVGYGLMGEVGWHRTYPWPCSITGASSSELADEYETKSGQVSSTNTTGLYQLIEWTADIFSRAKSPEDKTSIVEAIKTTKMVTTNGPIDFTQPVDMASKHHPVPNCVKASVCGGQWVKGTKHPFEYVICSNATAPDVPIGGNVQALAYGA